MQIAVLGRQYKISLAELEALFGAKNVTPVSNYAAIINSEESLPQSRLGGTIKSAKFLARLENTDLPGAFAYLQQAIPEHLQYIPKGKLQFGVSVYGYTAKRDWLLKQMLTLKKNIKKVGQSVRIIENKTEALEAAQVLYNKLTGSLGWELLLIKDGNDTLLAQTTAVQDIDAYAARDHGRPKRDAFVGMLPPKLAQIMINLATSKIQTLDRGLKTEENMSPILDPRSSICVLDPFCGTGVVLQEALLMGYSAYGSDISEKMVEYSTENLKWLTQEWELGNGRWEIKVGDATNHHWDFSTLSTPGSKLTVVCETYLGKPLTSLPDQQELEKIMNEANDITTGFLKNLAPQIQLGTKLCIALPAWHVTDRRSKIEDRGNDSAVPVPPTSVFLHLKVLDHLTDLGYNRLDLVHAKKEDLIYHRENQVVARELTILVRS